jgi:hypothetical protein
MIFIFCLPIPVNTIYFQQLYEYSVILYHHTFGQLMSNCYVELSSPLSKMHKLDDNG